MMVVLSSCINWKSCVCPISVRVVVVVVVVVMVVVINGGGSHSLTHALPHSFNISTIH